MFHHVLSFLQNLGKALMLPIAVLPVAGLMLRLGQPDLLDIPFLAQSGDVLFRNLPLLFAIGVAVGFSVDAAGAAALAGVVAYLTLSTASTTLSSGLGMGAVDMGVFAGILSGVIGGTMYNRFHKLVLPPWLAFFSGKRFVPIVSAGVALVLAAGLALVWPPVQQAINAVGNWLVGAGPLGAAAYGALNRLLLAVGLHQILNTLCWFQFGAFVDPVSGAVIQGDLHRFFAGDPTAGMFMTGFFPVMMFGLPAVALAFYLTTDKARRPEVAGLLISLVLTAFLTGITEPLEYTFMFLAPLLYLAHALLTGLSLALAELVGYKAGFTFSAGALDLILSWGKATRPYTIFWLGPLMFALYFTLFYTAIRCFKLKTPGREDRDAAPEAPSEDGSGDDRFRRLGAAYLAALGGAANVLQLDNCITRLRLQLADPAAADEAALKRYGAAAVIRMGGRSVQVVVGPQVEALANAMKELVHAQPTPPASPPPPVAPAPAIPAVLELTAPVEGRTARLDDVPDPTFAGRLVGDGIAIDPVGNVFTAPLAGTLISLPPSGHAFVIRADSGVEILVHIGVESVMLKGQGFRALAEPGMRVEAGTPIIQVNWPVVRDQIESVLSPVLLQLNQVDHWDIAVPPGTEVKPGMVILRLTPKQSGGRPC